MSHPNESTCIEQMAALMQLAGDPFTAHFILYSQVLTFFSLTLFDMVQYVMTQVVPNDSRHSGILGLKKERKFLTLIQQAALKYHAWIFCRMAGLLYTYIHVCMCTVPTGTASKKEFLPSCL